jgi:ankyrin repeat protein
MGADWQIVKELLIYGADVNVKDAEGFSFLDLTTGDDSPFAALHQLIAQAAKDPRYRPAIPDLAAHTAHAH